MQMHYDRLTFAGSGASPPLLLPAGLTEVAAGLIPSASCSLQYTIEDPKLINTTDGTGVTWFTWSPGSVAAPTAQALLSIVSAVRIFSGGAGGGVLVVTGRRD